MVCRRGAFLYNDAQRFRREVSGILLPLPGADDKLTREIENKY